MKVALFSKRMLRFDNSYKRCKKNWQVEIYDDVPHRNLTEKVFDCTVFFKLKFYFDVCVLQQNVTILTIEKKSEN